MEVVKICGTGVLTKNIDGHPRHGFRCTGFLGEVVAIETDKDIHITKGKRYKVIAVQGYGDVEDCLFVNDQGEIERAADIFFKNVEDDN